MADENENQAQADDVIDNTQTGADQTNDAARTPEETGASESDALLDSIMGGNYDGESAEVPDNDRQEGAEETADSDLPPDLKETEERERAAAEAERSANEDEDDDEPDPDAQAEAEREEKGQNRFRFKTPEDKAIAQLAKTLGIPLAEAARRVAGEAVAKPSGEQTGQQEETTQGRTSKDIEAELIAARDEKKKARVDMEWERENELDDKIEALREELYTTRDAEKVSAQAKQEKAHADLLDAHNRALDKAEQHYPDLLKADSAIYKKVQELDARAKELEDPIFSHPEKAWILAKKAALELGIPMTDPKTTKQTKPQTAAKPAATRPAPIANGNARTQPAAQPVLEKEIDAISTMGDYEKLLKEAGVSNGLFAS